jgi:hypothetical protein
MFRLNIIPKSLVILMTLRKILRETHLLLEKCFKNIINSQVFYKYSPKISIITNFRLSESKRVFLNAISSPENKVLQIQRLWPTLIFWKKSKKERKVRTRNVR